MGSVIFRKADTLTADELDILVAQCFANDMRTLEVAQKAGFARRSMENKVADIKRKFGVKTIPALVALFFRNKLIE